MFTGFGLCRTLLFSRFSSSRASSASSTDKGKVTAAIAKEFAESEFEKYRVIQDSLYQSDFDRLLNSVDDEI